MTINQLIKQLENIQAKHGKRIPICIEKDPLLKRWNEDYSHMDIGEIEVETIRWEKDDCYELADGSERMKTVVTFK